MRALGDKISSTIIAQSVDVSTLPWSGSRNIQFHHLNIFNSNINL